MTILIPAYEPNQKLLTLVDNLKKSGQTDIVIVNDGSGPEYDAIFQSASQRGCTILRHAENLGKGRALKTGFQYIIDQHEQEGVVTADCDGQHAPEDILNIAVAVQKNPGTIILGSRRFSGKVPLRSRFGNTVTRTVFRLVTGVPVTDTQTGLRGFPFDTVPFALQVDGDRFEYEMNLLLEAPKEGVPIREIDIATIYETRGHTSHFRTIRDSVRVYLPILKFAASSGISAIIDFGLLLLLHHVTGFLFLSVVLARIASATFNYLFNRNFVFAAGNRPGQTQSIGRYTALASLILGLNYLMLHLLSEVIGLPLIWAKLLTESVLYCFSYWAQQKFVFSHSRTSAVMMPRATTGKSKRA